MAITLTVDDLTQPEGELTPAMFPDGDLNAVVTAYLSDAGNQIGNVDAADHNAAAAAWVYHRTYSLIAKRLGLAPTREEYFEEISIAWGQNRVDYWERKAASALAQYRSYLTVTQQTGATAGSSAATISAVF